MWTALTQHHADRDPEFELRPDAAPEIRRLLAEMLRDPDGAVWLCENDSGLVGFCAVRIDHAPPILVEVDRAEITDLMVREGERRRGIGRALVDAALAWVAERELRRCEVRVATRNREGQAFWRALGFGDLMDVLHRRL